MFILNNPRRLVEKLFLHQNTTKVRYLFNKVSEFVRKTNADRDNYYANITH